MAIVYFDASALVKLVVDEEGTDIAVDLWDGCDAAVSSRLAYPEVRAALAAAHRDHRLGSDDLDRAEGELEAYWRAVRPVELTAAVSGQAGHLARSMALRGADAVHLASAVSLVRADPVVAAWDRHLNAAASAIGLRVAPALA